MPNENIDNIIKKFTLPAMSKAISEIKAPNNFIFDTYFTKRTPSLSDTVRVYIKKGAGVILANVSPNGEHLFNENEEAYVLDIPIPRFPLIDVINATDLNSLRSLESEKAQTQSLSQKIISVLSSEKNSLMTTLEYLSVGAMLGKITDGKGNVLFEFKGANPKIDFTTTIIEALNKIEVGLTDEFGFNPGFHVIASYSFLDKLATKANSEKLFNSGIAKWELRDNKRVLSLYGINFIAYQAKYKKAGGEAVDFIAQNSAIVIPANHSDIFELFYARANHIEAVGKAPTLLFSPMPEKLPNGRGYNIITEMRAIPVCLRPSALFELSIS